MGTLGIEKLLRDHFASEKTGAIITTDDGAIFFVDPIEDGGYTVQPKADLASVVKVWKLKAAAELISGWKTKAELGKTEKKNAIPENSGKNTIPLDDVFGVSFDEIDDDFSGASEEEVESAVGFIIDTDQKAEWALNKIRGEQEEFSRIEALAADQLKELEARVARINESLEAARKRMNNKTGNLNWMLRQFFGRVPHKATKTKETYQLLSGKLTITKKAPKPEVDEDTLLGYLKESGKSNFIKVTEKPMWGELKKTLKVSGSEYCDANGEIIPGVKLIPQEDEFKIEF